MYTQEYKTYRDRKNREYKRRIEKKSLYSNNKCLLCGKNIPENRKYCSVQCQNKHIHKIKLKQVEENNGVGCDIRQIKKYLLETRGHKCEICGIETWMNKPVPLVLDHINGDGLDNRLENLRLVCCNCDAQLPTYKSKNKHSTRKYRKIYNDRYWGKNVPLPKSG